MPKDDSQGTTAVNFQFNGLSGGFRSVTTNSTAALNDFIIALNASNGSIVLTLPVLNAAYKGKMYRVMRVDATLTTTATVVSGAGSQTINGLLTSLLTQYVSSLFVYDGSNWLRF